MTPEDEYAVLLEGYVDELWDGFAAEVVGLLLADIEENGP